jgi:hypothetical protein
MANDLPIEKMERETALESATSSLGDIRERGSKRISIGGENSPSRHQSPKLTRNGDLGPKTKGLSVTHYTHM